MDIYKLLEAIQNIIAFVALVVIVIILARALGILASDILKAVMPL